MSEEFLVVRRNDGTTDVFLTERWHYGGERLETALRNFFGREHGHMLLRVAVVSPQEVRVLCYPRDEREGLSESQFYTWRQRYLRDHPSVAKKLGVAFKPARTPSRPPQTRVHRSPCACPLLCGSGNRPLNLPMSPPLSPTNRA